MVQQLRNSGHLKTTRRVEDNQLLLMECSQNIDRSHNFMVFHTVLVLEQRLFVIFVLLKGLPHSVSQSIEDIYADHTMLSTSAVVSNLPVIQQWLQDDITKIANWASETRMVLKTLLVTGKFVGSQNFNLLHAEGKLYYNVI